jgi:hypothetical protein
MHFSKLIFTTLAMSVSSGLCAPQVGSKPTPPGLTRAKNDVAALKSAVEASLADMSESIHTPTHYVTVTGDETNIHGSQSLCHHQGCNLLRSQSHTRHRHLGHCCWRVGSAREADCKLCQPSVGDRPERRASHLGFGAGIGRHRNEHQEGVERVQGILHGTEWWYVTVYFATGSVRVRCYGADDLIL